MTFKVVLISNLDEPMVDDVLLANLNDSTREAAQAIANGYNNERKYYAVVKPADYEPYEFVP